MIRARFPLVFSWSVSLLALTAQPWAQVQSFIRSTRELIPVCHPNQFIATNNGKFVCKDFPSCSPAEMLSRQGSDFVCIKNETPLDIAGKNTTTYQAAICRRGGQYEVQISCPPHMELIDCSGGPGDLDENGEYWVLIPDYRNRTCRGYVGQPACFDNAWSRTIVNAHCYDPDTTGPVDETQPTPIIVTSSPVVTGDSGGTSDGGGTGGDGGDGDGDGGGGDGDGGGGDGGGGDGGGG